MPPPLDRLLYLVTLVRGEGASWLRLTLCLCVRACACGPQDVQQDVGGAQEAGLAGVLVRTGKYRPGDEATVTPPPWHVAGAFPDAVEHVLRHLERQRSGGDGGDKPQS